MALLNKLDPQTLTERLAPWLTDVLGAPSEVRLNDIEIPTASGMSSETVLFEAAWEAGGQHHTRNLVVRIPPSGEGLFPDYDIAREGRIMAVMATHTAAAVPSVVSSDLTGEVLGEPFLLLDRAYGKVPSDDPPFVTGGWVVDLTVEQRATMFDNALRTIVDLQQVDPAAVGLADFGRPGSGGSPLAREVEYWRNFYSWASDGRPSPTIDAAFDKLTRELPVTTSPIVVTWGDARFGNLMFADDLSVSGVFDWEMATLGPAEVDLGYFLFFDRVYSSGMGLPRLDGFPDRAATIARFEELTGRPAEQVEWFEAWGALRGAILLQRVGNLMISQGLLPADAELPFNNPAAQVLANLLELPPPAGQSGWITGNR
ncbi:phosphotransferase family protein [Mycolicibacterium porcinum]|uniref:phosphotransferase family protein n=1 Tax=Mycolicibacterium porcinum TaxID=39693 RepID=UPI0011965F57|nr:phosphotransferase family protein [Mycolicibacterium porcinum]TVX99230.1 phosphotransferase family protein [Mycolicibacterium porcinum]